MAHDAHSSTRVLWRSGATWRPLLDDLYRCEQPVAIVTINHTTRLLDLARHRQVRIPRTDGHRIIRDHHWHHLERIELATPCGIRTVGGSADDWHLTTPVLLVAGINLDDPDALDDVFPTSCDWTAPGHPDHSCGALHCEIDERNRAAFLRGA